MRTVKYEEQEKNTGGTENHIAVDEAMSKKFGNLQRAYNAGFAASDGVWGETTETDGRITIPEEKDAAIHGPRTNSIDSENPGLADN